MTLETEKVELIHILGFNTNHFNHFDQKDFFTAGKAMLQEMVGSFPGIDEAVSFSEVMK